MKKFRIQYGLGGGFGGYENSGYDEIVEVKNEADAERIAYESALEVLESYGGMHGLPMHGEDCLECEAEGCKYCNEGVQSYENFIDEAESWLDYHVEEVND
tara:strand:- start:147 stop:449 length:303 start_codon:yes stop_codon:yes gene_type:complete